MRRHSQSLPILILLMLAIAVQPVIAFAQTVVNVTHADFQTDQMAMMDCCNAGLHGTSGHSEQNMPCGDMASADCLLAANLGSCGITLPALVSEQATVSTQFSSGPTLFNPRDSYLSIILDTLTPPPNSSKA